MKRKGRGGRWGNLAKRKWRKRKEERGGRKVMNERIGNKRNKKGKEGKGL